MTRLAGQRAVGPGRIAQVKTPARVIRTIGLAVIGLIAGMQILDAVGINFGPRGPRPFCKAAKE